MCETKRNWSCALPLGCSRFLQESSEQSPYSVKNTSFSWTALQQALRGVSEPTTARLQLRGEDTPGRRESPTHLTVMHWNVLRGTRQPCSAVSQNNALTREACRPARCRAGSWPRRAGCCTGRPSSPGRRMHSGGSSAWPPTPRRPGGRGCHPGAAEGEDAADPEDEGQGGAAHCQLSPVLREPGQQVDGRGARPSSSHTANTGRTGHHEVEGGQGRCTGGTGEPGLIPACGRQCGNTASETPRWTLPSESAVDTNEPPAEQVRWPWGGGEGGRGGLRTTSQLWEGSCEGEQTPDPSLTGRSLTTIPGLLSFCRFCSLCHLVCVGFI